MLTNTQILLITTTTFIIVVASILWIKKDEPTRDNYGEEVRGSKTYSQYSNIPLLVNPSNPRDLNWATNRPDHPNYGDPITPEGIPGVAPGDYINPRQNVPIPAGVLKETNDRYNARFSTLPNPWRGTSVIPGPAEGRLH